MKAAGKIREYDPAVIIIFITTMGQYAIKGYEVDALDFVLKPVSYAQFSMKMRKAAALIRKTEEKYLLLPCRGPERTCFHKGHPLSGSAESQYPGRDKKQDLRNAAFHAGCRERLADCHFVRCNNSYLVNLQM